MDNSQYGISQYVGDADLPEVSCLIKLLYSDFVVTEIGQDGVVLEPRDETEDSEVKTEQEDQKTERDEPEIKRPKIFSEEDLESIESVASGESLSYTIQTENFGKDDRKAAHDYIRKRYSNTLESSGQNNAMVIKKVGKRGHSDRRDAWPKDRGDYLHFVLTKENHDHFYSLSIIAKFAGLNTKVFSVAGTKDRRAITSQLVCAYRVEKKKLLAVVPHLRGIWISNLCYSDQRLQLGCLSGNRFSIILREIGDVSVDELKTRIEKWSGSGFLNYFGHQRFGSCGVSTAEIGRLILASKWERAAKMILAPRRDVRGLLATCLEKYRETGDADLALQQLPRGQRSSTIEGIMLSTLKKNSKSYKGAILSLFRDARSLYIHAYQSLVFNKIVTRRIQKYGLEVLNGDLLKDGQKTVQGSTTRLENVMLPLPSSNAVLPENEVGKWQEEILNADDVSSKSFEDLERDFAVGDVARAMIVKPSNVEWEVLSYSDPRAVLQSCLFLDKVRSKTEVANTDICKKSEDVTDEKTGAIPKTDDGEELELAKNVIVEELTQNGANGKEESVQNEKGEKPELGQHAKSKSYRALKVQFDLPSSSYATVALRELLRTEFGKQAQKNKSQ